MKEAKRKRITVINPKIKKLAQRLGIQFRIADTPQEAGINAKPTKASATYYGYGVVWLKRKTGYSKKVMDIICLHEMGHAVLDVFLGDAITIKNHEIKANAAALIFAALLDLPVPGKILQNFSAYTKTRSIRMETI